MADPELIILGGGMAGAGRALTEPLGKGLQHALAWRTAPAVVVAGLGADAGVRGAALLAWTASNAAPDSDPHVTP
jgi:glucokinase